MNRLGLASFDEHRRRVEGDTQPLGQTQDVEDEAVTCLELGMAVGYLEEHLNQELYSGASQVIDGDLVLLLPRPGMAADPFQDSFTELDQRVPELCHEEC